MGGIIDELQVIDPATIPHSLCVYLSAVTTVVIRTLTYVFLRWIPSPWMPKTISPSFAIFLPAFLALVLSKPLFTTKSEVSEVSIHPRELESTDGEENAIQENARPSNGSLVVEAAKVKVSRRVKVPQWKTLALGIPNLAESPSLTILTFFINLLCLLVVYDATYTLPYNHSSQDLSFARSGWVTEQSARILVRESPNSEFVKSAPVYVVSWKEVPLDVSEKSGKSSKWMTIQMDKFAEANDYTSSVLLKGLKPLTKYQFITTGNHTGSFVTAPQRGKKGKFSFLTTSCIKQRVPYNPFSHALTIPGFQTLGQLLPELKAQFMLFLGDFIYIDVPMRPGTDIESYRMMYRQIYASKDWSAVGSDLPWIHVLDDHEIENDWDKGDKGLYAAAVDPYKAYQHQANPPPVRDNATYYTFNYGAASFFLLDTRRYRSPNGIPDGPEKSMLGQTQLEDLLAWLRKPDPEIQWKFIVSSVPLTKNWRVNGDDTWRGFQTERSKILEAAWGVRGAGVVVLSGDRHEFAATAFPPPISSQHPSSATIYEFSCSPLSQFYLPVRTYKQTDDEDVLIKYIPDGNSKFGQVEIDSTSSEQAVLKYRLFVDGKEVWSWVLTAPRL